MSNNRELGYVVGAVAGYFTGGFSYVALGATVGGIVGGLLDPKTQTQGPRLDDLKVQFSSYGVGVPRLYGTYRISPNVIWSTDKIELSTTTSQGKGGGGTENTSYSYFVQMRQLYVETQRDGSDVAVVKSFRDGKIIYDASTGASLASSLATAENPYSFFTLYQGHPDQLPDPVEEIYQDGPGSVPAYRGVVSNSLKAIECPGGRVPQFSHVLSAGADVGVQKTELANFPADWSGFATLDAIWGYKVSGDGDIIDVEWRTGTSVQRFPTFDLSFRQGSPKQVGALLNAPSPQVFQQVRFIEVDSEMRSRIYLMDLEASTTSVILDIPDPLGGVGVAEGTRPHGAYDAANGNYAFTSGSNPSETALYSVSSGGLVVLNSDDMDTLSPIAVYDNVVYYLNVAASVPTLYSVDALTGSAIDSFAGPFYSGITVDGSALTLGDGFVYVFLNRATAQRIYSVSIDDGTWKLMADDAGPLSGVPVENSGDCCTMLMGPTAAAVGPDGNGDWTFVRYNAVETNAALVSAIIAEECERAGETRYDVSAVPDTDTVIGYVIASPASARANIDPLLTAFQIFIVDEDGTIKFKKYEDIVSVAEISFDELGQAEDGAEPSDAMPLVRTQEIDLPRSVSVSYIEPTYDYQTATETEVRQVTESTEDMLVSLPMAITSDQARKAAANILFSLHRRQNTRSLKVSRKFAFLSPGDGTMIEYPRGTWKLWRWVNITDTGALIEGTVEPGDAELYSQVGIGATGYVSQEVPALAPPSQLTLLDMPILRDVDSNAGAYAAIRPYTTDGWRGSYLLAGNDNVSFEEKGSVSTPAVAGFAESALEDGPFGVIDHFATFIVNVGSGELNTTTWDAIYTGQANLAALKTSFETSGFPDAVVEIFQFRVATSLGDGRYELSELIRGLYGTEQVAFNHRVGDKFVLLNGQGMIRAAADTGSIGSITYYKAVSLGRSANSVASTAAENIGYGLKPLSPINVKLDRTPADGSIVFTWGRRTRLSHNALRSIMPLGEAGEVYEVVIYTAPDYQVVERVYRVYSPTFVYLSVDLASDGYGQSVSIPYRIYQISDAVGRGVPFQPGQGLQ